MPPPPDAIPPEAIRALAAQVTTGAVSATDALAQLRRTSREPPTCDLRWSWEPLLRALVEAVDHDAFLTVVDTLCACARGSRLGSPCVASTAEELAPFADLLLAAELLVYSGRPNIDRRDPRVRRVLRALIPLIEDFVDVPGPRWIVGSRARDLAWAFPDVEVALAALDFIASTAWAPVCAWPIDEDRHSAKAKCMAIVSNASESHSADIEVRLVELLTQQAGRVTDLQDILALMGAFGGRASLDAICRYLATPMGEPFGLPRRPMFAHAFRLIERKGFDPDLIRMLNATIEQQLWRARLMTAYHAELREYASRFEATQPLRLYDRLAPGGVQYWDYWLTYAPPPGTPEDATPVGMTGDAAASAV